MYTTKPTLTFKEAQRRTKQIANNIKIGKLEAKLRKLQEQKRQYEMFNNANLKENIWDNLMKEIKETKEKIDNIYEAKLRKIQK